MRNYKELIGDGKLPNAYWVFHYDEKATVRQKQDGSISVDFEETKENPNGKCLGEFKTFGKRQTKPQKRRCKNGLELFGESKRDI